MDADQLFADYELLLPKIAGLRNFKARRDLLNIVRTCENIKQAISIESVTCRRLQKPTVKYTELLEDFSTALGTLSEYTTLALLLDS